MTPDDRTPAEGDAAPGTPGATPDPLAAIDPLGLAETWLRAATALVQNPAAVVEAGTRFTTGMMEASAAALARATGGEAEAPLEPGRKDRRFRDPTWSENPAYFGLLQSYLLSARYVSELVDAIDLDDVDRERLGFLADLLMDAVAPTNFLATNPAAQKRAVETGGASLVSGMKNMAEDLASNEGLPRQVKPGTFVVGRDLAVTPGKVVFRNHLMELIQYAPRTERVHEIPLLLSPPWINKYYIMDLAPGRSFVEWAVDHGHTAFAISYRNPDADDRHTRLDDYLLSGPIAAMEVIREITGQERVNLAGLCLGGTLTAALLAYLANRGEDRVASTTLLNTLVDFRRPGRLGAFTDEASITRLEQRMAERGYLDSSEMMGIFTFLRSNDLVWTYAVNNWLMGEDPPPFDILAWNADGTRMPVTMHSFYLRSCYLNNELAVGRLELDGVVIDPAAVTGDLYLLAAQEDHITPWPGAYLTTHAFRSTSPRFVLSAAGHIAGIVNPPSPKAWYRTNDALPESHEEWLAGSTKHEGSWWEDWSRWIGDRAGAMTEPPPMGSAAHPPLGDAPGEYVLGK